MAIHEVKQICFLLLLLLLFFDFFKLVIAKTLPFKVVMRNEICLALHLGILTSQTLFVPQCRMLSECNTKSDQCCGTERVWLARLPLEIIVVIVFMCGSPG